MINFFIFIEKKMIFYLIRILSFISNDDYGEGRMVIRIFNISFIIRESWENQIYYFIKIEHVNAIWLGNINNHVIIKKNN